MITRKRSWMNKVFLFVFLFYFLLFILWLIPETYILRHVLLGSYPRLGQYPQHA